MDTKDDDDDESGNEEGPDIECRYKDPNIKRVINPIQEHINKEHQDLKLSCDQCDKKFWNQEQLDSHSPLHTYNRGDGILACNQCDYTATTLKHIKQHISGVHLGIRPHQCHLCNHASRSKAYLKVHMQTHKGEKPHTCPVCNKAFTRKSHVTHHRATVHSEAGARVRGKCLLSKGSAVQTYDASQCEL